MTHKVFNKIYNVYRYGNFSVKKITLYNGNSIYGEKFYNNYNKEITFSNIKWLEDKVVLKSYINSNNRRKSIGNITLKRKNIKSIIIVDNLSGFNHWTRSKLII